MVFIHNDRFVFVVGMVVAVGPVAFHLYGLLIGLGILLGAYVGARVAKVKLDKIWDGLVWVVGGGLIGARLYHVLDLWQHYWLNPGEIVMIWQGGMGIFGGIVGGGVGLWFYSRKRKEPFLPFLDVAGIGLPVGQAIGRWGNYFNQELYGKPTSLPWGIFIKPENRLVEVIGFERFHPLFLYESLWVLLGLGLMMYLIKKKRLKLGRGKVLVWYLGWYGTGRFFLEWLKIEVFIAYGVNVAQVISLGLIGLAVWWFYRRS